MQNGTRAGIEWGNHHEEQNEQRGESLGRGNAPGFADCAVGPGAKPESSSPPVKPTDAVGSLRIVGAVVGGLAVAGLTAALVLTLRARSPQS